MLADGRRLHLQDGPIDIVAQAFGDEREVEAAYRAATTRFIGVLDELCGELEFLRQASSGQGELPSGVIARRMATAVAPYASTTFITPMAAVAGAVAEEILLAMTSAAKLSRAYVNDGGDIAFHLAQGERFVLGMVERPDQTSLFGTSTILSVDSIRGIATSGWRGRSFSLGIADAVTILAESASMADAAATVVANAVDLTGHPAVGRVAAFELAPDSDLGNRFVTQSVGELAPDEIREALDAGVRVAQTLCGCGLIRAAALRLQGQTRVVGVDHRLELTEAAIQNGRSVHA
jgi:hypothetical protein